MADKSKDKIIDLNQLVQKPGLRVWKYDEKTTKYFYHQSDVEGFEVTYYQCVLYFNAQLYDFHCRVYSEKPPRFIDTVANATLYTSSARVYKFDMGSINFTLDTLRKLGEKYKVQAAKRTGDRAIDSDAILQSYDIAARNEIRVKTSGARDYFAGGSGDKVWVNPSRKEHSGVEYGTQTHLFTPAEYEIVFEMLKRSRFRDL